MRYLSIDLETTGLDARKHQVIEFGAVLDDLREQKSLELLPSFHAYILPPSNLDPDSPHVGSGGEGKNYLGDPFALQMNARILERIAKREPGYRYLSVDSFHQEFERWCIGLGLWKEVEVGRLRENGAASGYTTQQVKFVAGGKNYGTFDRDFCNTWLGFKSFRVHHRVVDPAMLFLDPAQDDTPPDLATCLERAGIEATVTHEAVEDALLVVKLLRAAFPLVDGVPTRKVFECPVSMPTP